MKQIKNSFYKFCDGCVVTDFKITEHFTTLLFFEHQIFFRFRMTFSLQKLHNLISGCVSAAF